jgi:hypothetical protein
MGIKKGDQLSMFMPAQELRQLKPTNYVKGMTAWEHALSESTYLVGVGKDKPMEPIRESIEKRGVLRPVTVRHPEEGDSMLSEGHHRVAHANDIDPSMEVPVEHV